VRILIVGAGAAGGYLGAQLVAAGRAVTFLVRPQTQARLATDGLRISIGAEIQTHRVDAVTSGELGGPYDVVVLAVRTGAVEKAIDDIRPAVGPRSRIVPLLNGLRHLTLLTNAFGQDRVLGAATRLIASLLPDGTVNVVTHGIAMELGQLDGATSDALDRTVAAFDVDTIAVRARRDILAAMWEKFAFITSTAVLTCLIGAQVGPIVRAEGGTALARRVLAEVAAVAAAEGYPLADAVHAGLDAILTDPSSTFGPSMYRDMAAHRPVEITVLGDLADRARRRHIDAPLLDASIVAIDVHNRGLLL
jgi:2-dehydropantoate 2-reductase